MAGVLTVKGIELSDFSDIAIMQKFNELFINNE
jgi:hypothetical protein